MKEIKMCKCGICQDDCEYHKEVKEEHWDQVGFTSRPNPKNWLFRLSKMFKTYENKGWIVPEGVEYVIVEGWGGGGGGSGKS